MAEWRNEWEQVDRSTPVFGMPKGYHLSKIIRADLATARAAWIEGAQDDPQERERREQSGFLAYRDAAGRVLDFHALRHTFVTNLARAGVHPKVAQQLARHSTITLTMDRYSHTVMGELSEALEKLPALGGARPERERQAATGTDGNFLPTFLPKNLPTPAASAEHRIASRCTLRLVRISSG